MFWNEIKKRSGAAWINGEGYESVIYQGIKIVKDEDGFHFLSTESDMYPRVDPQIVELFWNEGLDVGLRAYRKDKYERQLRDFGASRHLASGITAKLDKL